MKEVLKDQETQYLTIRTNIGSFYAKRGNYKKAL